MFILRLYLFQQSWGKYSKESNEQNDGTKINKYPTLGFIAKQLWLTPHNARNEWFVLSLISDIVLHLGCVRFNCRHIFVIYS